MPTSWLQAIALMVTIVSTGVTSALWIQNRQHEVMNMIGAIKYDQLTLRQQALLRRHHEEWSNELEKLARESHDVPRLLPHGDD